MISQPGGWGAVDNTAVEQTEQELLEAEATTKKLKEEAAAADDIAIKYKLKAIAKKEAAMKEKNENTKRKLLQEFEVEKEEAIQTAVASALAQ